MDFRDITEFFKDTFKYIVVAVVVLLLFIFVIGIQQVVGPSMSPTLTADNLVVVNKLIYRFKKIEREDIVILSKNDKYMIKRVIGLPGERIEYINNVLYVNGVKYDETFIDTNTVHTNDFSVNGIIPEGKYLVLGDNREDSQDSRDYGLIEKKEIIGKVWFSFWPLNKIKIF